jgi:hypothetical protein
MYQLIPKQQGMRGPPDGEIDAPTYQPPQ